jgi:hypothetical protein
LIPELIYLSPVFRTYRDFINIDTILEPSFSIRDLDIISTHLSLPHPSILLESPIFKTITSIPLPSLIVIFIPKLDCDLGMDKCLHCSCCQGKRVHTLYTYLVICESKQFLPEPVSIFAGPFLGQKIDDLNMSFEKGVTVAPDGIFRVGVLDNGRVPDRGVN